MTYTFSIYKNTVLKQLTPIVNNLTIIPERDSINPLQVRMKIAGDLTLYGDDYTEFEEYVNEQLTGIIKVDDYSYNCYYQFSNEKNPQKKIITVNILFKDKYSLIYENETVNYSLGNVPKIKLAHNYYNEGSYKRYEKIYYHARLIPDIIETLFNQIDSTIIFDDNSFTSLPDENTYALCYDEIKISDEAYLSELITIERYGTLTTDEETALTNLRNVKTPEITLKSIFDLLTNLSIYWYIDFENKFRTSKDFSFGFNEIDISEKENIENQQLTFDQKFKTLSLIRTKKPDIDFSYPNYNQLVIELAKIGETFKSYFGYEVNLFDDQTLKFNYQSENEYQRNINFNVDIYSIYNDIKRINYSKITGYTLFSCKKETFSLSENPDIYSSETNKALFDSSFFSIINNILPSNNQLLTQTILRDFVSFQSNSAGSDACIKSKFMKIKKGETVNYTLRHQINANMIMGYVVYNGSRYFFRGLEEFSGNGTISGSFERADTFDEIEHIYFYFLHNDAVNNIDAGDVISFNFETPENQYIVKQNDDLRTLPNYQLGNDYLLENNVFTNMPFTECEDAIGNVYTFSQKNNIFRELYYNFDDKIKDIDFNSKIIDSDGNIWRIEKIERRIINNFKSVDKITISR